MLADDVLNAAIDGALPTETEALALADFTDTKALATVAATLRDRGFLNVVTYSRKVFIPLTHLCRDVCHYCTFAQTPKKLDAPYLTLDQVLDVAREGAALGCKEALFTLGEKPELRYRAAREWLTEHGYETTLQYLRECGRRGARGDRPPAASQSGQHDARRNRGAAGPSPRRWGSCSSPPPTG